MTVIPVILVVLGAAFAGPASAGDLTIDAAVGGAIGGAVGGVIGAELGGRDGAIAGAGLGAAAGVAINTSERDEREYRGERDDRAEYHHRNDGGPPEHPHASRFCPPGQAKKGRC